MFRLTRKLSLLPLLPSLLLIALTGCDDSASSSTSAEGTCEPPAGECFRLGWVVSGEQMSLEVLEASPQEPVRGLNSWVVALQSPTGELLTGCALHLEPYMPDHRHGSNVVDSVEQGEGRYLLEGFDLIMPGYWTLPIEVTCPEMSAPETLTFELWLEG